MRDFKNYIWKGARIYTSNGIRQDEKKLINMNESEVNEAYVHCWNMIYSTNKDSFGRMEVLKYEDETSKRCLAEILVRKIRSSINLSKTDILQNINNQIGDDYKGKKVSDVFENVPEEFNDLPLEYVIKACSGRLGYFSKKHFSKSFILHQGIWLTSEETESFSTDAKVDKFDFIKDALGLHETDELLSNPTGLSYSELRAMLNLKNIPYSELTTNQLELLFYKELPLLEDKINSQIEAWKERASVLFEYAKSMGYNLTEKKF